MRDIIKNIQLPIDGKPMDFRMTKLDAFSGAALLQLLTRLPLSGGIPGEADGSSHDSLPVSVFTVMSPEDLRSVMTSCLNHVEVLLPAGYQPVMQGPSWSWPELEHDTVSCLKLTVESIAWSLSGFFGGGGLKPPPEPPASSP